MVMLNIYVSMPKPFLPSMLTSIASNVAFFAASHLAQEIASKASLGVTTEEAIRQLKDSERRFGFGKFIGTDGDAHIGIEWEPFVQALNPRQGLKC